MTTSFVYFPTRASLDKSTKIFVPSTNPHGLKHKSRSLEFRQKKNMIVVNWRSGNCGTRAICEALGVDPRELNTNLPGRIVRTYPYLDAAGRLLYQKTRHEPGADGKQKDFRLWSPDGKGGWFNTLNGVKPVLFRLPQLLAKPDELVFIPEGEKDCEYLESLGLLATTNFDGAGPGKWKPEYSERLRGRNTVVCADTDKNGLQFAEEKAQSLYLIAACN